MLSLLYPRWKERRKQRSSQHIAVTHVTILDITTVTDTTDGGQVLEEGGNNLEKLTEGIDDNDGMDMRDVQLWWTKAKGFNHKHHAHVNCVPVERGLGSKLRSKMMSMAGGGFDLKEIQNDDLNLGTLLRNAVDNDEELTGYFYAEIPVDGESGEFKRFLYKHKRQCAVASSDNGDDNATSTFTTLSSSNGGRNGNVVPLQFGREVLATVLKDPDKGNWKACTVSKEQEKEWTDNFRQLFSKKK